MRDLPPSLHDALQPVAKRGAFVGRIGGVRRATGSSSEHVALLDADDDESVADAISAVWLQCSESPASWKLPLKPRNVVPVGLIGCATDVDAYRAGRLKKWQHKRAQGEALRLVIGGELSPLPQVTPLCAVSTMVYSRAKRLSQRRSIARIRNQDGITPPATDRTIPKLDAKLDAEALVARCSPHLRERLGEALFRHGLERGEGGNAIERVRSVCRTIGEAQSLAIVALSGME